MKKVKYDENEDQEGGAVVLGLGAAALGIYLWLRSRKVQPAAVRPAFALVSRSHAQSQPGPTILPRRDFKEPQPRFGYDSRAAFGFVF